MKALILWFVRLFGGGQQRELDAERTVQEVSDAQKTDAAVDRLSDDQLDGELRKYERRQ